MKIETHYWARANPAGQPEQWPFMPRQGARFGFTWNEGYYRDQALELVNAWNREIMRRGDVQHQYYLDP